MLRKTTLGAMQHFDAKWIYKFAKTSADILLKTGQITAEEYNKKWASIVSEELIKRGLKVSKKILEQLK